MAAEATKVVWIRRSQARGDGDRIQHETRAPALRRETGLLRAPEFLSASPEPSGELRLNEKNKRPAPRLPSGRTGLSDCYQWGMAVEREKSQSGSARRKSMGARTQIALVVGVSGGPVDLLEQVVVDV